MQLEQQSLKVQRYEQDQLLRGLTLAEQDSLLDLRPSHTGSRHLHGRSPAQR